MSTQSYFPWYLRTCVDVPDDWNKANAVPIIKKKVGGGVRGTVWLQTSHPEIQAKLWNQLL